MDQSFREAMRTWGLASTIPGSLQEIREDGFHGIVMLYG
jgi:hypothetical protein